MPTPAKHYAIKKTLPKSSASKNKESKIQMPTENQKLETHKIKALDKLNSLLSELIESDPQNAERLSYWIENYVDYFRRKETFDPKKMQKYKRGEIIYADLGYRIGNEHSCKHYCIVLDNKNPLSSTILTVVPMTSYKQNRRPRHGDVNIGSEIYDALDKKLNKLKQNIEKDRSEVNEKATNIENTIDQFKNDILDLTGIDASKYKSEEEFYNELSVMIDDPNFINAENINKALCIADKNKKLEKELDDINEIKEHYEKEISRFNKTLKKFKRMKNGSIALVDQITTISKIRIIDPINSFSALSGIRVSDETLNKIDKKLKFLFTNVDKKSDCDV